MDLKGSGVVGIWRRIFELSNEITRQRGVSEGYGDMGQENCVAYRSRWLPYCAFSLPLIFL